jgi:hypothetical protein
LAIDCYLKSRIVNQQSKNKKMNKQEERLLTLQLDYFVYKDIEKLSAGNHLMGQIIRSSTFPALNYGEAQSAESKKDFIHKMGICLMKRRTKKT